LDGLVGYISAGVCRVVFGSVTGSPGETNGRKKVQEKLAARGKNWQIHPHRAYMSFDSGGAARAASRDLLGLKREQRGGGKQEEVCNGGEPKQCLHCPLGLPGATCS